MSSEKSIASARASVMIYDDVNKKWIPSGTSSGLSKVHVFQHQVNNTFRVVGRKLQNQEVVINCVILKSLKYNQATATFHQWRDNKQVYGLNFSSKEDADAFAHAMLFAVEVLATAPRPPIQQFPSPPVYPQSNGQYEEDMGYRPIIPMQQQTPVAAPNQTNIVYSEHNLNHTLNNNHQPPLIHQHQDMPQASYFHHPSSNGNHSNYPNSNYNNSNHGNTETRYSSHYYVARSPQEEINYNGGYSAPPTNSNWSPNQLTRTMTREDVAVIQERRMSQQSQMSSPSAVSPPAPPGHHRTSSAPPAPAPPPLSLVPPPPPPAMPPSCPPPPPFPQPSSQPTQQPATQQVIHPHTLPRSSSSDLHPPSPSPSPQEIGSLAAQLQSARLKRASKVRVRASKQSAENSGSSTTSSSSGGGYGTLGRGGNTGMASMMDEMAKTLARRRAAVEKKEPDPNTTQDAEGGATVERRAGSVGSVTWNSSKSGSTGAATTNGWESPKTSRKTLASSSEDVTRQVNGEVNGNSGGYITPADLDNVKQEILREMRRELGKIKTEIVDAIKLELSKR